ncbi:hypothetical protein FIU95_10135 [Microbulbifer sp. THAF38]|nr:hypothetical protein FIU95_10135 [Microbulbifer sp. THAF38]
MTDMSSHAFLIGLLNSATLLLQPMEPQVELTHRSYLPTIGKQR